MAILGEPILVGVIGGTGVYDLSDFLTVERQISFDTPWGLPSSPITIGRTTEGNLVAFISRHGLNHEYLPSNVPFQANIAALKKLGVRVIVAISAVGSLQAEIRPQDFVLPNQIIDRTKGIRPSTFFEDGCVAHCGFGEPFNQKLHKFLDERISPILTKNDRKNHSPRTMGKDVTLVCMEGPAFSTRSESRMYRLLGGDVINMSCIPEAKLAAEAEICYQMICMSTDYDAWRQEEKPVDIDTIYGNLQANQRMIKCVLKEVLDPVVTATEAGELGLCLKKTMSFSVTKPIARPADLKAKIQFIHPEYY